MKKCRDKRTGQWVATDYTPYIGKTFEHCTLIDVRYIGKRKVAILKCNHCGKTKRVNAVVIFNETKRFCSCECLGVREKGKKKDRKDLLSDKKLRKTNTSGITNVYHITKSHGKPCDRWEISIIHDKKHYYIGSGKTKDEAMEKRRRFIIEKGWLDE